MSSLSSWLGWFFGQQFSSAANFNRSATSNDASKEPELRLASMRNDNEIELAAGKFDSSIIRDLFEEKSSRETMQWYKTVTSGIETKFTLVHTDSNASDDNLVQLDSVYNLAMRINDLEKFVTLNGLMGSFLIHSVDKSTGKPIEDVPPRNLLKDHGNITLDEVRSSVKDVKCWREDHLVWAETVTLELIQNSCDTELCERVNERLMGIPSREIGGATYFKVAMDCITTMSKSVSTAILTKLTTLSAQDIPGEDILKIISFIRGAVQRLEMSRMLPGHIDYVVYQILKSTSNNDFNDFFKYQYAQESKSKRQDSTHVSMTVEELLDLAEHEYRTLLEEGKWTKVARKGSRYNVEEQERKSEANNIEKRKSKHEDDSSKDKPFSPKHTPPGPNEPHERMYKGQVEYWCDRRSCHWNRTHKACDHVPRDQLKTSDSNKDKLQNGIPPSSSNASGSSNAAFLMNGFNN